MKHFGHVRCDKAYGHVLLAAALMMILPSSIPAAKSVQAISLKGKVDDVRTGKPLEGAMIIVSGWTSSDGKYDVYYETRLLTNGTGGYAVDLQRGYYYLVAMADDPMTPGLDYVPQLYQRDMTKMPSPDVDVDFHLMPGATIAIKGLADFVELGRPPDDLQFIVIDARNGTEYHRVEDRRIYAAIDLEPGLRLVPANVPMLICGISPSVRFVVDDDGGPFAFPQGSLETIDVDISEYVMKRNLKVVSDLLNSTRSRAVAFNLSGIDVKLEVDDLNTALGYMGLARLTLFEKNYPQCFMNLRAAYIIAHDVDVTLANTLSDVAFSPIPLTFLTVLSAFGLASVFVGRDRTRIGSGLAISTIFLGISYFIAPGWKLADPARLLEASAACALVAIGLITLLPRINRDVVTPSGIALMASLSSTFSLATRNLRRRRLRTSLILASIFTLVFGFTVFTSFRFTAMVVYGDPAYPYPSSQPPEGLMMVPSLSSASMPMSLVEALMENPLIASVAPKTETSPYPLDAQLIGEGGQIAIVKGAIGISSEETFMSHLDAAVVNGHFMAEGEERAILISASAAERLRVEPGDKVKFAWGTSEGTSSADLMVAGILDDQIFGWLVDLDGQPIRPYFIVEHQRSYVSAENAVVLNWKEFLELGLGTITRINVQTRSTGEVVTLANELARKWRYYVYATMGTEVKLFYYRKDPMLVGSSNIPIVLALVGLNVLACTLNAAYERRKEVVTLSLVGLNPSQISYIFLAEAVLVAFIGGEAGYLLSVGVPRLLFSIGGPGFLTEKTSWIWSIAAILIGVAVTVSASVFPAHRASTIATPHIPRKWKLEYLPEKKDVHSFYVHIPQVVSKPELGRFIAFVEDRFSETLLLTGIPEKMELRKMVDESDEERDVIKLLFDYRFAREGERAFLTENELVMSRGRDVPTYSIDLAIRIGTIYNYNPLDVVWKTASAIRQIMIRWTTAPSRWG